MGPRASQMTRQREGEKRDATTAATPAQLRSSAVGPDAAGAPDAYAASATPFYTGIAAASDVRLVPTRPHLAGPGGRPVII